MPMASSPDRKTVNVGSSTAFPIRVRNNKMPSCIDQPSDDEPGCHGSPSASSQTPLTKFGISFLDQQNLRICPKPLRQAFRICSEDEYPLLACTISCVHSSRERLFLRALCEAVTLFMDYPDQEQVSNGDITVFKIWLQKFGTLFFIYDSGQVTFANSSMRTFLEKYTLHGIDASQKTIAMLCLAQVGLNRMAEHTSTSFGNDNQSFAAYAAQNYQYHRQVAMKSSISLSLSGFRVGNARASKGSPKVVNCQDFLRQKAYLVSAGIKPTTGPPTREVHEDWELVDVPDRNDS